jgi:hypothetical protein
MNRPVPTMVQGGFYCSTGYQTVTEPDCGKPFRLKNSHPNIRGRGNRGAGISGVCRVTGIAAYNYKNKPTGKQ